MLAQPNKVCLTLNSGLLLILRLFCPCVASVFGADVTGQIQSIPAPGKSASKVVVFAESLNQPSPVKPGHFEMVQQNKTFSPHVLTVPVGSTVSFPNFDPIFHNVFSLSPPGPFDLGLYRAGRSKSLVFNSPGTYRVFCNIHPQMTALLLVVPTAWIAAPNTRGTYHLDLPPGRYRLTAWSERSSSVTVSIDVESSPVTVPEIKLDESNYVEVRHRNKYGQDYPSSAYGPLRH